MTRRIPVVIRGEVVDAEVDGDEVVDVENPREQAEL